MQRNAVLLSILILSLYSRCEAARQPSYQVTIYVQTHPEMPPTQRCYGAIIQSRLVLTTASCLYESGMLQPQGVHAALVSPELLRVVAGNRNAFIDPLTVTVNQVNINEKFNMLTLENDLAVLRLKANLPLGLRDDIKWIMLDDYEDVDGACLVNLAQTFQAASAHGTFQGAGAVPLGTTAFAAPIDSVECRNRTKYPRSRKQDLCLLYAGEQPTNCYISSTQVDAYDTQRGTGLLCNNRLVAVLSAVLPSQPAPNRAAVVGNCTDTTGLLTFYTELGQHLNWIYKLTAYEEYIDIMEKHFTFSEPYQGEVLPEPNHSEEALVEQVISQPTNSTGNGSSEEQAATATHQQLVTTQRTQSYGLSGAGLRVRRRDMPPLTLPALLLIVAVALER